MSGLQLLLVIIDLVVLPVSDADSAALLALTKEAVSTLRAIKLDLTILKIQLLVCISINLYYIGVIDIKKPSKFGD